MTGRERPRRDRRGRLRDGAFVAQPGRDTLGDAFVHGREPTQQPQAHRLGLHFAQFKDEGGDDVVLLWLGLVEEKQASLTEVVGERRRSDLQLVAGLMGGKAPESERGVLALRCDIERTR